MLNQFKVLNGDMPLKFDSLNTIYTININNGDEVLKFEYKIADGDTLSVFNNTLDKEVNEVVLTVYNDHDQMSYYFYVYKEQDQKVVNNIETKEELETSGEMPSYIAPSIASICFLFILLFFTLLFKKSKKCKF